MLEINLIRSQVPSEIDLPKKQKGLRNLAIFAALALFLLAGTTFGVYLFFKHSIKKSINTVSSTLNEANRVQQKVNKGSLHHPKEVAVSKKKTREQQVHERKPVVKKQSKKQEKSFKHKEMQPQKTKTTVVVHKEETHPVEKKVAHRQNKKIHEIPAARRVLRKQKTETPIEKPPVKPVLEPVFSVQITLENIPKPIKKQQLSTPEPAFLKPHILPKKQTAKKVRKPKKRKVPAYRVIVTTTNVAELKQLLSKMGITAYSYKRVVVKRYNTYDIYVGGFDSYPALVEFAKALKKKGYRIYGAANFNLLFYVCIDRNVSEELKKRYLLVWSHTPFKIVTKQHTHAVYAYRFVFVTNANNVKLLKKRGYYPIIRKVDRGA